MEMCENVLYTYDIKIFLSIELKIAYIDIISSFVSTLYFQFDNFTWTPSISMKFSIFILLFWWFNQVIVRLCIKVCVRKWKVRLMKLHFRKSKFEWTNTFNHISFARRKKHLSFYFVYITFMCYLENEKKKNIMLWALICCSVNFIYFTKLYFILDWKSIYDIYFVTVYTFFLESYKKFKMYGRTTGKRHIFYTYTTHTKSNFPFLHLKSLQSTYNRFFSLFMALCYSIRFSRWVRYNTNNVWRIYIPGEYLIEYK